MITFTAFHCVFADNHSRSTAYAVSTLDPGGGGSGVAAPSPGGTGGPYQQGPDDSFHTDAAIKVAASVGGLLTAIATIVAVQLLATA